MLVDVGQQHLEGLKFSILALLDWHKWTFHLKHTVDLVFLVCHVLPQHQHQHTSVQANVNGQFSLLQMPLKSVAAICRQQTNKQTNKMAEAPTLSLLLPPPFSSFLTDKNETQVKPKTNRQLQPNDTTTEVAEACFQRILQD